jgi:DNA-binding response OmpR family regulator
MPQTKMLLVSADDTLTNSITTCLSQAGYQVLAAQRGSGAIDLIQAEKPDLIILDSYLPDFSSLAILRALRTEELFDQVPVILTGSSMGEEDVLIGLEVGADLCLLEAFHPQVFVARVRSLLRRTEALRIR